MSHYPPQSKDTAIILSCFGSVVGLARYTTLLNQLRDRFPHYRIELALTSKTILNRLESQGVEVFSLPQQLARLERAGLKRIIVTACYLFPTDEYSRVEQVVAGYNQFSSARIEVTPALLHRAATTHAILNALVEQFPTRGGEVNLFLLHGTANLAHPGSQVIQYAADYLERISPFHRSCTLEGAVDFWTVSGQLIDTIKQEMGSEQPTRVRLIPLLLVSGNHFDKDLKAITAVLSPHFDVEHAQPISGDRFSMLEMDVVVDTLSGYIDSQLSERGK